MAIRRTAGGQATGTGRPRRAAPGPNGHDVSPQDLGADKDPVLETTTWRSHDPSEIW